MPRRMWLHNTRDKEIKMCLNRNYFKILNDYENNYRSVFSHLIQIEEHGSRRNISKGMKNISESIHSHRG